LIILKRVGDTSMGMERWWNAIDRGKPNYWEKNLSQCQSVHHKSHNDWPNTEWWKEEFLISDWEKYHEV
jgi:hypothetical protein